jgi:hypothetical protein
MHCASPQFAPDPVWTARVLLEHYVDSRTQLMADEKWDINHESDAILSGPTTSFPFGPLT